MKNNLCDLKFINYVLGKYGFKFSKSLGQNFIIDNEICPQMASCCANSSNSGIIEIGPGLGVLTVELAKRYKKIVSIEVDKSLIPILHDTTSNFKNIKLINDDVLRVDLAKVIKDELKDCSEVDVCANLPYYITSNIIMYILESELNIKSIVVMVQKEAAQRICAAPGTRDTGVLSFAVKYYGNPRKIFDVGRESFFPVPGVDSSVIRIDLNKDNSMRILDKNMYFRTIKAAYGTRRKNILNSLSENMGLNKSEIKKILSNLGLEYMSRAEQLSFDNFIDLSNEFFKNRF